MGLNIFGGALGPTCLMRIPPFFPILRLVYCEGYRRYRFVGWDRHHVQSSWWWAGGHGQKLGDDDDGRER